MRRFQKNINCAQYKIKDATKYTWKSLDERVKAISEFIIDNNATVRGAAGVFGISKSSVHKDVSDRVKRLDPALSEEVKKVLELNKNERHIRGGEATRTKYKKPEAV